MILGNIYLFITIQKQSQVTSPQHHQSSSPQHPSVPQQRHGSKSQQLKADLFKRFDIKETSYHLYTGRIDLHLCDDVTPGGTDTTFILVLTYSDCYRLGFKAIFLIDLK